MGRNNMKNLVLLLGLLFPLWSMASTPDPSWWLNHASAAEIREKPRVMDAIRANVQSLGEFQAKLRDLGIITYPPAWDALQKELAARDRRGRHDFLSILHPGHPVLHDFTPAGGAGGSLHERFTAYLNDKFATQEDLKSSAATERPKFDAIIESVRQESEIRAYQRDVFAECILDEDQKYMAAEALVFGGDLPDAVVHVIPPLMVRGVNQTFAVANLMIANPHPTYDQAVTAIKTDIYTHEVDTILLGRMSAAQRDAMIAEMVARDVTGPEALEHALTRAHGPLAPAIVARMVANPAETVDQAFQAVRMEGMAARYAIQLARVDWRDGFLAHVAEGGDAHDFIRYIFIQDLGAEAAEAALERFFNQGIPYLTIITDARIEPAMRDVHGLGVGLTELEQKALAMIMVERGIDAIDAFGAYLREKGCNDDVVNSMTAHLITGDLARYSLDEGITLVTIDIIKQVFQGLTDAQAKLVGSYGVDDLVGSLKIYLGTLQDGKYAGKEDTLVLDLYNHETLTQALKKQDARDAEYATLEGLALPDFPAGSPALRGLVERVFALSDEMPELSQDEVRLRALTEWVAQVDRIDMGNFEQRQMATHIAGRMLAENKSKDVCSGEFMARRAAAWTALHDFARNNYRGGFNEAQERNQKLFAPITTSDAWGLTAGGGNWTQEAYDIPIIHVLADQLALQQLPFHGDATDAHWETNRDSLTKAMIGVLEHKNREIRRYATAYVGDDGLGYADRIKNKLLRAAYGLEAKAIAEGMFEGIEGEYGFGKTYEEAQREVGLILRGRSNVCASIPMFKGEAIPFLHNEVTGTIFARLFPELLEGITEIMLLRRMYQDTVHQLILKKLVQLTPEQTALLEDMIFLRFIPARGVRLDEIKTYRKLAKMALSVQENKLMADLMLESLADSKRVKFRTYGVAAADLERLVDEAVFGGENFQGLSDETVLKNHYHPMGITNFDDLMNGPMRPYWQTQLARITGLAFAQDPIYLDDTNFNDLLVSLVKLEKDVATMDEHFVKTVQLAECVTPAFKADHLKHFHATPADILKFAQKVYPIWQQADGKMKMSPAESWPALYRDVPAEVEEYEAVSLPEAQRAIGVRQAYYDQEIARRTEITRLDVNSRHPLHTRYHEAFSGIIAHHNGLFDRKGWRVNFESFRLDPYYTAVVAEEKSCAELSAQIDRVIARLRAYNADAHTIVCMNNFRILTNGLTDDPLGMARGPLRKRMGRVLQAMEPQATQEDYEKVCTASWLFHEFDPITCIQGKERTVCALETRMLGLTGSFPQKVSQSLRRWLGGLIDNYIISLRVGAGGPIGREVEAENGTFLSIVAHPFLGVDAPNTMQYEGSVTLSGLDADDQNRGSFRETWTDILGGFNRDHRRIDGVTPDAMVTYLQSNIQKTAGGAGEFEFSCAELTTFAKQSSMLFEYVAEKGPEALWDNVTHVVKPDVVKMVLFGLGYLDFDPARAGLRVGHGPVGAGAPAVGGAGGGPQPAAAGDMGYPECGPKLRRFVPVGARKVWVGTDASTDPMDPLYRR